VADIARHVDVRQELHADQQLALPLAVLAAPALDVEAEAPRRVAAHLALRHLGIQRPDPVEHLGVRGRIAAGRPPDGTLVDVDNLVDLLQTLDGVVVAGPLPATVQHLGQPLVQDLHHQRALAAATDAGHTDELPQRDIDIDVLKVVLPRTPDRDPATETQPSLGGHGHALAPGEIGPGQAVGVLHDLLQRAFGHDLPAMLARARPQIDDPVGVADGLVIVLHDQQRVAQVAHLLQRADQAQVIALVEADGRLVQHVEHAGQAAADLRRQADALRLPTAERTGRPRQRQVVQTDIDQEANPRFDLLENLGGDAQLQIVQARRLPVRTAQPLHPGQQAPDRHLRHVHDAQTVDGDGQGLRSQPLAQAGRAFHA